MLTLTNTLIPRYSLLLLLTLSALFSCAVDEKSERSVSIQDAWVRPTNPGQEVGAAYMTFTSKQDMSLISVEADATKSVEIHSMTMENGVMEMRMLDTLPLKAGVPYKLMPGGFHFMLFDLKKPLTTGELVNFTLTFKNNKNVTFKQKIQAPVKDST
ncbi:MAG: copper chaperone PCu(A)C [Methylotenera sp.]|nr:copper chaperone PCu(A)C [Methylotenera sp.]